MFWNQRQKCWAIWNDDSGSIEGTKFSKTTQPVPPKRKVLILSASKRERFNHYFPFYQPGSNACPSYEGKEAGVKLGSWDASNKTKFKLLKRNAMEG
jgi:hypothetical protein